MAIGDDKLDSLALKGIAAGTAGVTERSVGVSGSEGSELPVTNLFWFWWMCSGYVGLRVGWKYTLAFKSNRHHAGDFLAANREKKSPLFWSCNFSVTLKLIRNEDNAEAAGVEGALGW